MTPRTLADGFAQRDNNFNLIRVFAALLVIYGHAYPVTGSSGQDVLLQLVKLKFAGGIAVDMFFVISGFLIAASLERNRLPAYLAARALRIFPALIVCVALSVFVLGPLLTTAPDYWGSPQTWKYLRANILLKNTAYFLPGVFETLPSHAVNGSLWSLPIEFRLYLLLGLVALLGLFRPSRFNALYIVTISLGFMIYGDEALKPDKSNLAYCTAFFLTGSFAWVNRDRIVLSWPLLLGVLVFAAALRGGERYHVGYFLALTYGTLFLAFVPKLPRIRHHDLSYGLYLYGWPSQQLVQHFAPGTGPLLNALWATLIAGALAALSWHFVELPALGLKKRFATRTDPNANTPAAPRDSAAMPSQAQALGD